MSFLRTKRPDLQPAPAFMRQLYALEQRVLAQLRRESGPDEGVRRASLQRAAGWQVQVLDERYEEEVGLLWSSHALVLPHASVPARVVSPAGLCTHRPTLSLRAPPSGGRRRSC